MKPPISPPHIVRQTLLAAWIALLSSSWGLGHELDTSYCSILLEEKRLTVVYTFDVVDLGIHFALDSNGDGEITGEELLAGQGQLQQFLDRQALIRLDRAEAELEAQQVYFSQDKAGNAFMNFPYQLEIAGPPHQLSLRLDIFEDFGPGHRNLLQFQHQGEVQQAVLSVRNPSWSHAAEAPAPFWESFGSYLALGVEHILLGYDHILFLMALIVIGKSLSELVKIVTAFTVAHSITLALATLQVVAPPTRWVEAAIALSIAYVAAENFWVTRMRYRWLVTFFFGLVHGFGFASVLSELGLPPGGLAASLLAFNLGVEIGQICIVALLFPVFLYLNRGESRQPVYACSGVILLFGLGWFVERVFGLSFMPI